MKRLLPYSVISEYYYKQSQRFIKTFHSHHLDEIYYFHSGSGEYIIGDRTYPLVPGDLIIMDGLTPHGAIFSEKDEFVRTMFQFDSSTIGLLEQQLFGVHLLRPFEELHSCKLHLSGEDRREFEQILRRFHRFYMKNDVVSRGRFLLAFYDMLLFIYEQCLDQLSKVEPVSDKERTVRNVIVFIEQHFFEEITLDDIVHHFHMSKQYVSKIFREVTGLTIMEYIYQRRINQAKMLFYLDRDQMVTDVCFQVGFKNLSHFSRLFKKQEGLPPEQYKRNMHPAR